VKSEAFSTLLLAILLGAIVYLDCAQVTLLEHLRVQQGEVVVPGSLSSSWVSSGITRTVTTTRNVNETVAQWQDRHFAAVKERMDQYPPD
jgi:hypothetical protein